MSYSTNYTVPNMRLIPQDRTNACWYAATQMVVQWRREAMRVTEGGLRDPSQVPNAVQVHKANNGLLWAQMRQYAQQIGLVPLPLMSPMPQQLEQWMRAHGPLWCDGVPVDANGNPAGAGHVVVVSGIRGGGDGAEVRIHDPWPPNVGNVSWRPIDHLTLGILSAGTNINRDTFFLRLP